MIMKLVFTCLSKYDYETLNNFFYLSKYRLMILETSIFRFSSQKVKYLPHL